MGTVMAAQLIWPTDAEAIRNHYREICKEAEAPYAHLNLRAFQALSADEKCAIINDINARGRRLIEQSSCRDQISALQDGDEEAWREAQLKVIAAHKARHPDGRPTAGES